MEIAENEKKPVVLAETESKPPKKLLEVKNLKTYFYTEEGIVKAVDGVSFDIYEDEVLGLVGETGCGKSVTALSILRLVRAPGKIIDGEITFKGRQLLELNETEMRERRGKDITMIFQDPLNSLNPVFNVGKQVSEVFMLHQKTELKQELDNRLLERKKKIEERKNLEKSLKDEETSSRLSEEEKSNIKAKIKELKKEVSHITRLNDITLEWTEKIITEVGIPDAKGILKRYPYELSGGMRQRVMIAMGLSCNPALLIADEPTTALDVTIQAQILDLMKDLKNRFKTSIFIITHDLGIIAELCDRVAVMYSGNIVEYATAERLFKNPRHPYTKGLIGAIPSIEKKDQKLQTIRGMVPNLIYPPSGCRFHPRCDNRLEICDKVKPPLNEIAERYFVACHLFDTKYKDSPKFDWIEKEGEITSKV
ncbi:MAG: peptide ABC transporter ATP-binding protein [Promethearchaeota archaeon Loki_b32]|nr:MAG: peptide ABC transporter ATP-binding protein [Candidatus Lokiarchaeota archaeon Loki_b32]